MSDIEKFTNEFGKECYRGVTKETLFSPELLHKPEWQPKDSGEFSLAFHCELGSLTVLRRMTGFSFGMDTESGFRDKSGKFWLASGGFDLRDLKDKTVGYAIDWVKSNANNCRGE